MGERAEIRGGRQGRAGRALARGTARLSELLPTVRGRLFALVVVALLPSLVILSYDEWLARQRGLAAFDDLANRVVRLLQLDLGSRISRAERQLTTIAGDPEVVAGGPLVGRRLVDGFREARIYNNVLLLDGASGELRVSAVPYDEPHTARERASFRRAVQTLDFGIGNFLPEPVTGRPGLNVALPVVDERGTVASVLYASLAMLWVDEFVKSAGLPQGTVVVILDDQGIVQYRSLEHETYEGKPGGLLAQEMASALASEHVLVGTGVDGVERLFAASRLEFRGQPTGAVVGLGIPLGPWRTSRSSRRGSRSRSCSPGS